MQVHQLPLSDTGMYGKLMMDYLEGHPDLRPFYNYTPSFSAFPEVIDARNQFPFHRDVVADCLDQQHRDYYSRFPILEEQVRRFRDQNTYTVTTGHQPCLAGGPLYFFYKIITTINLARELRQQFPEKHFIPVFWLGAEDHDLQEVNHFHLHGETIRWNTEQQGATGRMRTAGIESCLRELAPLLEREPAWQESIGMLQDSYAGHAQLSDATRALVLAFFGGEGLLVLDADRPALKKIFCPLVRQELSVPFAQQAVMQTSAVLGKQHKLQVVPREINLFYLGDQLRERIVMDHTGHYQVLNTDLVFSRDAMLELAEVHPEHFSPNVILRPVYQELLLPNLAYVGGPGELAYWLQLKALFTACGVSYPMLVPRAHAVVVPARGLQKFRQMDFELRDIFRSADTVGMEWLNRQEDLSDQVADARKSLQAVFEKLALDFSAVDATLAAPVMAEAQRTLNSVDNLMKKGNAALKRRHEVGLQQIRTLLEKVNPADAPQERTVNLFQFYSRHGRQFIDTLLQQLKPLNGKMLVIEE